MKRLTPCPLRVRGGDRGCRRGTMFHYYMVYLFLSSVIMLSSGMCLHALLKADRLDTQAGLYLHSMQMLERSLRKIPQEAEVSVAGQMLEVTIDGQVTTWQVDQNLVRRIVTRDGEIAARERFLFAKGTEIEFARRTQLLRCRLIEPSFLPDSYQDQDTQRATVDFLIALPGVEDAE